VSINFILLYGDARNRLRIIFHPWNKTRGGLNKSSSLRLGNYHNSYYEFAGQFGGLENVPRVTQQPGRQSGTAVCERRRLSLTFAKQRK